LPVHKTPTTGTWCNDYYSIPQRPITLIRWKVLCITVKEVLELLSILEVLPAIRIVVWYLKELLSC
jgi:hypothetical protein